MLGAANSITKTGDIHHNWFHDSFGPEYADGRCAGIYLDNDSKGYDVHHNVVWNISWSAVQMNWDAWNNDIFNNTFWNVGGAMDVWLNGRIQTGNRVWNNYADGGMWKGQSEENNLIDPMDQFRDLANLDFRPADDSDLVNAGKFIEGITVDISGWAPDIGAYERGLARWVPGAPRADGVVTAVTPFFASRVRAQISPNPANGFSTLKYTSTVSGRLEWIIVSPDGKVQQSGLQQHTTGEQQLELDLRLLPTGPYVVIGKTDEGSFAIRMIVQ